MSALDLRCPVERPVASCRKVARQQSFESRSHGLSLKLYARSCPGSFEGGSCRYHTVFYLLGDRLRGRALDAPFVEVFDAREHAWPCIRYKGKGGWEGLGLPEGSPLRRPLHNQHFCCRADGGTPPAPPSCRTAPTQ